MKTLRGSLQRRFPASTVQTKFVASISPIVLPDDAPVRREPPRPPERREPMYMARYDDRSLFFDVYRDAERLVTVGPLLRNLGPTVDAATFSIDGMPITAPLARRQTYLVDIGTVAAPAGSRFELDTGWHRWSVDIQPKQADVFAGRRVLCTISKDNRLTWIRDWAEFHVRAHGADAVLFYDNASTRYDCEDVLATLSSVQGLAAVVVVPWPFKFGPRDNGPYGYDSHYAQPAMREHARRRFLSTAAAMVNLDVDELVVSEDGRTLFDHLEASPAGAILYHGQWIEKVRTGGLGRSRHRFYRHRLPGSTPYPTKWTIVPSRIPEDVALGNHVLDGMEGQLVPQLVFRHFRSISTGWKYRRSGKQQLRRARYQVDQVWLAQMRRIGWA